MRSEKWNRGAGSGENSKVEFEMTNVEGAALVHLTSKAALVTPSPTELLTASIGLLRIMHSAKLCEICG